jgi:predicted transcriptional regulator
VAFVKRLRLVVFFVATVLESHKSPSRPENGFKNLMAATIITMRANIINQPRYIMNTRETLILKALKFKALHSNATGGDLIDRLFEQNPEQADAITKNVCARIPSALADRMEQMGGILEMNKREIITAAVIDFLDQAEATISEFDAWPSSVEGE